MSKIFKGLVAISDVLDDRYQNLCDRYHALELSHNRKKKALDRIQDLANSGLKFNPFDVSCGKDIDFSKIDLSQVPSVDMDCLRLSAILSAIYDLTVNALYSDGRVNQRCFYKKKGVKNEKTDETCKR